MYTGRESQENEEMWVKKEEGKNVASLMLIYLSDNVQDALYSFLGNM